MGGTLIEAILAVIIAGIVLQVINYLFQGPNLKVKHKKRQIEQQKVVVIGKPPSFFYRHIIEIRNTGNTSGNFDIIAESDYEIKQSLLMVNDINNLKVAPLSIEKGTTIVFLDCYPVINNQKYWLYATYEKSFLRFIYERKKTIWSN